MPVLGESCSLGEAPSSAASASGLSNQIRHPEHDLLTQVATTCFAAAQRATQIVHVLQQALLLISLDINTALAKATRLADKPEHGSPLASAKSNLPVIKTFSLDELDVKEDEDQIVTAMVGQKIVRDQQAATQEDAPLLADLPNPASTEREDSRQDNVASQGNASLLPEETPEAESLATELVPVAPSINITASSLTTSIPESIPFPSADTPSPRKPSWFGSLSRAKGRAKADQLHRRAVTSVERSSTNVTATDLNAPLPITPAAHPPATTPIDATVMPLPLSQPPTPIPSPPQAVPRHPTSKRSWFSSPRPPTPERTNSVPSSIDEEVPFLAVFPSLSSSPTSIATPTIVTSPSSDTASGRPRLSSLNPSTSRFALSIPLLGRPKVLSEKTTNMDSKPSKLLQFLTVTLRLNISEVSEPSPAPAEPNPTSEPATVPTIVPRIAIVMPDPSPVLDPSSTTAEEVNTASSPVPSTIQPSSSWWSYVGWSSSSPLTTPTPAESAQSHNRDVSPTPTVRGTTPASPADTNHNTNTGSMPADASVQALPDSNDLTTTPGPKSGDDGGSVFPTSSSSWYNPWTWYPSTSTSTLTLAPTPSTATETATPTPAEKPDPETRRTLTRDKEEEDTARVLAETLNLKNSEPEPEPEQRTLNPVEATITMNRSGWASFFSSKSLFVKSITAPPDVERDENGMEVMDVPDDEPQQQLQNPIQAPAQERGRDATVKDPATSAKKPGKREKTKEKLSDKSSSLTPSTSRSSSVTPASNLKGKAPPLIIADSIKFTPASSSVRSSSPAPSMKKPPSPSPSPSVQSACTSIAQKSKSQPTSASNPPNRPTRIPVPNLILPSWSDTFHTLPRSQVSLPPRAGSEGAFSKTMRFVSGVLFAGDENAQELSDTDREQEKQRRERAERFKYFGKELPRAYDVANPPPPPLSTSTSSSRWGMGKGKGKAKEVGEVKEDVLRGCKRVVVIGVHGWFPGAVMRSVIGEPTGTSSKFVNMTVQALEEFQEANGVKLEKITKVPLEGEGTIEGRVTLYANLKANQDWMDDIHTADAVIIATHSQGSIVSTHLLDRLIQDRHIQTLRPFKVEHRKAQRVCCLALCGIHLGPLRYLSSSSLLQPYFQYFETAAARELFEFQNTESEVSKNYVKALKRVVDHGTKMVYVASLNDQVVPIYSGLFAAASHPLILRALYIDGDAYHSSDFLSNLLVLLIRILNSGISDSGLTMHLSEATAGSLSGVGHSTVYEEISTYTLAIKYLFLTDDGLEDQHPELIIEPFNAATEQNDYEIPWSLRDVIADERVIHFFSREIAELRDAFRDWHPKTTILRDLKRKLQPIQRLPATFHCSSSSKL
ncbi:hypothetical protein J132_11294 [Termitomyces sp. J132]|nr:hypothetical protein J132_11294 [Termitomyces sp. J132]